MVDILREIPIFAALGKEELAELSGLAIPKEFAPRDTIFWEDDPGDALYLLLRGAVKIYRVHDDGREQILSILHPGDLFGEMAVLQRARRSAAAQALIATEVLVFPERDFRSFVARHPQTALQFIILLCERLRKTNHHLELLLGRDVRARLFSILREQVVQGPSGPEVRLTHQDLGALVGASRETITRILLELQAAQCIIPGRGRFQIIDWEKIKEVLIGE
ncbi:MAG: Crp/Fnr family transcriptional regulator [Limnochordia bacterium]|jgi:CRP/FNR family cyclic AMP-dependent transcriptional regulator